MTRAEAEAALTEALGDQQEAPRRQGKAISLSELMAQWLDSLELRGTTERTRRGYRAELAGFLEEHGARPADKLTTRHVERWLLQLVRAGRSRRTRSGLLARLKQMYAYGRRLGLCWSDPCAGVEPPRPEQRETPETFSVDDLRALLAAARGHDLEPFWLLLISTGARPGECAAAMWETIDWAHGTWTVRQSVTLDGSNRWIVGPVKTRRERTVQLAPEILERLRPHRGVAGLICRNPRGEPLDLRAVARRWTTLITRAGVDPRRMYACRHSWASIALASGISLAEVAEHLGHSVEELSKVYAHAIAGRENRAAGAVAGELFG